MPPHFQVFFEGGADTILAHNLAIGHGYHRLGLTCNRWIVGHNDERDSLQPVQLLEQAHQILPGSGIQAAGRLICQHQWGLVGAGSGHPLALSARKLAGQVISALCQSNQYQ